MEASEGTACHDHESAPSLIPSALARMTVSTEGSLRIIENHKDSLRSSALSHPQGTVYP
ncbi:MAG: hypothetical protein ACLUOI_17970 [Eisenbergiella sp.]